MKISLRRDIWLTGTAIFSMFFGAGNFALPMLLGGFAGSYTWYASLGFILTAILVPALGLIAMLSFQGDYRSFLARIGPVPGFVLMVAVMALVGPFGALPRCISLSYSTISYHLPHITIGHFSLVACFLVFLLAMKKSRVIEILGRFLTPILLVSISVIILLGIFNAPSVNAASCQRGEAFWFGFTMGPQTLDLFGSFFFASLVLPAFSRALGKSPNEEPSKFFGLASRSCFVGMGLLALVYGGLSIVAARHCLSLPKVAVGQELSALAYIILGGYGGFLASVAVSLACLTTAIALAAVFTEFVRNEIFKGKASYLVILACTMGISFVFARIGFKDILELIAPCLLVLYPAAFVLTLCNLGQRFWGFRWVKLPFYATLSVSVLVFVLSGKVALF